MKESEYRKARFLVEVASDGLQRLIAEHADAEEIASATKFLANAQKKLDAMIKNATEEQRRAAFTDLVDNGEER